MKWYVNDGQSQRGPFEEAEIVQLITTGQLAGGHLKGLVGL